MSTRELVGKKIKGKIHERSGFVISQIPDFKSRQGFELKVVWDVESWQEAKSIPSTAYQVEHSNDVELA